MALHFDLCVNHSPIATFKAVRRTNTEQRPNPDDVSTYEVTVVTLEQNHKWNFHIDHRYGDGSLALVHSALGELLAADD